MDAMVEDVEVDNTGLHVLSVKRDGPFHEAFCQSFYTAFSDALLWLEHPKAPVERRVHLTRRCIKRLRAMLRLLKPSYGDEVTPINAALRDTAHLFSGNRDLTVTATTLHSLKGDVEEPNLVVAISAVLSRFPEEDTPPNPDVIEDARNRLTIAKRVFDAMNLPEDNDLSYRVAQGYIAIYRRGKRDLEKSVETLDTEVIHDWRKAVQHRRFAAQLFKRNWPEPGKAPSKLLGRLSDFLGEDHDLDMASQAITAAAEDDVIDFVEAQALQKFITAKRKSCRLAGFELGAELYAPKVREIKTAWAMWAEEQSP